MPFLSSFVFGLIGLIPGYSAWSTTFLLWMIGLFIGPACAFIAKSQGKLAEFGGALFALYVIVGGLSLIMNFALVVEDNRNEKRQNFVSPEKPVYSKKRYLGPELINEAYKYVQSICSDDSYIGRMDETKYRYKKNWIPTSPGWMSTPALKSTPRNFIDVIDDDNFIWVRLISFGSHANEVVTIETFNGSILRAITLFDEAQDFSEDERKILKNKVELNESALENFCNGNERYLGGPPKINSDT